MVNIQFMRRIVMEQQTVQQNVSARQLRTNRGLAKYFFLSLITLGIYSLVCFGNMSSEINLVASRYDGKKTMNYYLLFFLIGPLTFGIGTIVWLHKFSERVGAEAARRSTGENFGASTFWLWNVLGSLIIVGPFIYIHKLFKAMNAVNADFNAGN